MPIVCQKRISRFRGAAEFDSNKQKSWNSILKRFLKFPNLTAGIISNVWASHISKHSVLKCACLLEFFFFFAPCLHFSMFVVLLNKFYSLIL